MQLLLKYPHINIILFAMKMGKLMEWLIPFVMRLRSII